MPSEGGKSCSWCEASPYGRGIGNTGKKWRHHTTIFAGKEVSSRDGKKGEKKAGGGTWESAFYRDPKWKRAGGPLKKRERGCDTYLEKGTLASEILGEVGKVSGTREGQKESSRRGERGFGVHLQNLKAQ